MSKLNLMTTIVDRNQVRKYLHLYEEEGLQIMLVTLGDGTASGDVLDYLGLEATEKAVIFSVLTDENFIRRRRVCRKSCRSMHREAVLPLSCPSAVSGGRKHYSFSQWVRIFRKRRNQP